MDQARKTSLSPDTEDRKKDASTHHRGHGKKALSFCRDCCKSSLGPSSAPPGICWSGGKAAEEHLPSAAYSEAL